VSRSGIRRLPAALTLTLALIAPAAASASPSPLPRQLRQMAEHSDGGPASKPVSRPSFALKTSDGYEIEVLGLVETGSVLVEVTHNGGKSSTGYAVRGTATAGRLRAGFGRFGKIAMRFRPAAARAPVRPGRVCKGRGRFVNRTGTFVGEFHFRGEGGYVSATAKRAKGHVVSVAAKCQGAPGSTRRQLAFHPDQSGEFGPDAPYVSSGWKGPVSAAEFLGLGGKKATFFAGTEAIVGGVSLFHFAMAAKAPAKDIKVSDALTSARLSPPPPFKGTATYRATPDGTKSWAGSLTVNFPGAPRYPLTGPLFKPALGLIPEEFLVF
jgi:hypothetical protein